MLPLSLLIGSGVINVLIILFNVFFIVEILKKKEIDFFKKKTFYLLLLLWVYLIFNAFIGINFENSLDRSIGFIRFNDKGGVVYIFVNPIFRKKVLVTKLLQLVKEKTGKEITLQEPISTLGSKLLNSLNKWK